MRRFAVLFSILLVTACQPTPTEPAAPTPTQTQVINSPSPTGTPQIEVPAGINPLTGLPAADPSLLKIPAVLISISQFPATARPQAGLSFAPFVYDYYITEGTTRYLAVFYGQWPHPELRVMGGCESRPDPFVQTATLLGNRVWFDSNGNGIQDTGEEGIDGLCVNLYDASGNLIQRTSTDTNGYYGFNVLPGKYSVEFVKPAGLEFSAPNVGDDSLDSDADPVTGRAEADVSADDLSIDAGLVTSNGATPPPPPSTYLPLAQVGPVRSGRLMYRYIADYFKNSCLMFAGASPEELPLLPECYLVFHQLAGGGYMLDIDQMQQIALDNQNKKGSDFDYASNVFSERPPSGGALASGLDVYIAYLNQSGWVYDPLYQAYLRSVDTSEFDLAGVLHPDTDRLTGRQLHFENLIILFAKHEVISPTNLDIHLDPGTRGDALLLRDGEIFKIQWKTDKEGDRRRPIAFEDLSGNPFPLKPGHTWILVVTPDSTVEQKSAGEWLLTFAQPPGAKQSRLIGAH